MSKTKTCSWLGLLLDRYEPVFLSLFRFFRQKSGPQWACVVQSIVQHICDLQFQMSIRRIFRRVVFVLLCCVVFLLNGIIENNTDNKEGLENLWIFSLSSPGQAKLKAPEYKLLDQAIPIF